VREIFDRAISQRGPMLVAAICFFFSPARHLTRFKCNKLLPHRSIEHAKLYWDRRDTIPVGTERERAEQRAPDHRTLNRTADRERENAQSFAGDGEDRVGDGRSDRGDTRFADAVGASGDCTICTSTFGISSMRSTW
jgi:hypothetical protein